MIDPVVLGYGFLAILGLGILQMLFLIWLSYEGWRDARAEVKSKRK